MKNQKKLFRAKRILAMLLAAVMVFTAMPATTVNASEVTPVVTDVTTDTTIPATGDVTDNETEPITENPALVSESEENTPDLKTEIKVDLTVDETTAVFNGTSVFTSQDFLITLINGIHVYVDGVENVNALNALRTSWKQLTEEGEVALEGAPVNAGTYYLDITLEAKEGCYSAAKQRVTLTITKAPLTAKATVAQVMPGTKAGDVSVSNISAYCEQTDKTFTYTPDDAATEEVDESEESQLSYSVKIKDAITGEVLDDNSPLVKGSDYVVELTLAFTDKVDAKDKGNYELLPASFDITMSGLVSTAMELKFTDTWSEGYAKTYDGNAVSLVKDTDYTVKVVRTDNSEEVLNPELKEYWTDDNDNLLEAAPTKAGTYYYVVSYKPDDNILSGCKSRLKVVINPAELIIKPTVKTESKFYPGTKVYEVLEQADYLVYDANGKDITNSIDKNTFWGAYDEDGVSYPFVPLFTMHEVIAPESETLGSVSYRKLSNNDTLEAGKSYCVSFSGYLGFYTLDGHLNDRNISINDVLGNGNYKVDTSSAKLLENAVAINLAEGTEATIDVSGIFVDDAGADYENPITKTYDTGALYKKATDYQKAVVKVSVNKEETTLAKDADESLTYTWFSQTGETDGKPVWSNIDSLPVNAGNYRLVVSYKDSNNVYYAEPTEVFYKIEKQKVRIIPAADGKEYTAWAGDTVSNFLNRTKPDYEIVTIKTDDTNGDKLNLKEDEYSLSLQLERKVNDTWSAMTGSDTFEMEGTYRLTGKLQAANYYTNETVIIPEIIVQKMGTTELEVKVDASTTSKMYDGEAFDTSNALENGLITIVTKEEEPVSVDAASLELVYNWRNSAGTVVDAPVNAGTYYYYVSFPGNETYKAFEEVKVATFTISKRPLIIEPVVKENIVAGPMVPADTQNITDIGDLFSLFVKYNQTKFNGVVEKDKAAFNYQKYYDEKLEIEHDGWPAFTYNVTWLNENISFYTGIFFFVSDKNGRSLDYDDILKGETEYDVMVNTDYAMNFLAEPYKQNYIIIPKKKSFTTVRGNSTVIASVAIKDTINKMQHTITAKEAIPYSYDVTNIETGEELSGNFVTVSISIPSEYTALPNTALFENSIKKAGGFNIGYTNGTISAVFDVSASQKTEFDIRWEVGYTEHFILDFKAATLLTDLRNAVAPKSLAFNGPSTKMVVGETQQLDVKLTKVQASDTIRLIYSVDNKEILHVDENGLVVALKKGSATVTVSPAHLVDNKLVPIEGAKTATVKITVNDVSAPKINKVIAVDTEIMLEYTRAKNGSRHEIYVLEGKKTANDFEAAISSMKNYKWQGIFAIAPVYVYDNDSTWYLDNLEANTAYTVYVRNVTLESTLDDGCKITQSHAGAVKNFTTTKQMADGIRLSFADENAVYNERYHISSLTIPLLKGSTSVSVKGLFLDNEDNESWETLPLSKALQSKYANPKLIYEIYAMKESYEGPEGYITDTYDPTSGKYIYIYTTKQASIDKNGKIKVTSAGDYIISVSDEYEYNWSSGILHVTASADSITGKKVKLKVGQSMSLYDMVIYKEGKKVITGSFDKEIVVDEALLAAFENSTCFRLDGTTVTATKPGTLSFSVKDATINGATATVTISATAMDAVKNLKTNAVTDQYFDLEFTHSGDAEGFHITVTNASGTVIRDIYAAEESLYNQTTGKYGYRIGGLTAKSKYNVSVTAVFEDSESKAVKKSVTTTLTPISYVRLDKEKYGGVEITLPNINTPITSASLVSGNTYTLLATGDLVNLGAVYAETDSLTWTSSNKKVATVKATKGSVFATLQALKAGTTTIEVKSKITNAVIARYVIEVKAVGNAYDYYGDNEDIEKNQVGASDDNALMLSLSYGLPVSTNAGEYKWLKFTATSDGYYTFYSEGDYDSKAWFFRDMSIGNNADIDTLNSISASSGYGYDDDGGEDRNFSKTISLTAGETVYIAVGYYSLNSSMSTTVYVRAN